LLLDLGCGDGTFLEYALLQWLLLRRTAVDASRIALHAAIDRLKKANVEFKAAIVEHAALVQSWSTKAFLF
jgi:cyclopropane fatty-acyl-phospholipid synthase-like methyltransferase